MSKILHLTLKKAPFDVMVTGEKKIEYRKPSNWILSRIEGKEFDFVKFTNGYGPDKPYFICQFGAWSIQDKPEQLIFSNGLIVDVDKDNILIHLGDIIETGNLANQ